MKQIASPGSMHETGCSGLVHWNDPKGWCREGGGSGVQDGEYVYTCGGFMSMAKPVQYCKVISLQLNYFFLNGTVEILEFLICRILFTGTNVHGILLEKLGDEQYVQCEAMWENIFKTGQIVFCLTFLN